MIWSRGIAITLACAVPLGACQVIGGFHDYRKVDEPGMGAGGTGAGGVGGQGGLGAGGEGGDMTCALESVPERPDVNGGGGLAIVLAMDAIDLGEGEDGLGGLDLDGKCTCDSDLSQCACAEPADGSCVRPVSVAESIWLNCDEPAGVDANSKQFFKVIKNFSADFSSAEVTVSAADGIWTMLFAVESYNGELDDDDVLLGVYSGTDAANDPCNAGGLQWTGDDVWPLVDELVASGQSPSACDGAANYAPTALDPQAYVTDGRLVARIDRIELRAKIENAFVPIVVRSAILTFDLSQSEGVWRATNGTLAGTWVLADLFDALARLEMFAGCGTAAVAAPAQICKAADMLAIPGEVAAVCDGMSFYAGFSAIQARFGPRKPLPLSPIGCQELADHDCDAP